MGYETNRILSKKFTEDLRELIRDEIARDRRMLDICNDVGDVNNRTDVLEYRLRMIEGQLDKIEAYLNKYFPTSDSIPPRLSEW